jgi:hypothetical protein
VALRVEPHCVLLPGERAAEAIHSRPAADLDVAADPARTIAPERKASECKEIKQLCSRCLNAA